MSNFLILVIMNLYLHLKIRLNYFVSRFLFISLFLAFVSCLNAQKEIRNFIFGHSLINHEFKLISTPSQETSVPHWMHFLADHANHNYVVDGQFGFLPQHANLPPIAQWGFDYVSGVWDSDNEPFANADFTHILITPGNFIQWQSPGEAYPTDNTTPIDATERVLNWCNEQENSLNFYIYENWPDMATYLSNGFPPNDEEWKNYNNYLNEDFHTWFLDYHDQLLEKVPNVCVSMIPVGPIVSHLLSIEPYDKIPITTLYEDDAPHGRPTIYFLSAMISYMAMYEEKTPPTYEVESIIDPIIAENYEDVVNIIWNELNDFNKDDGSSRVFCSEVSTSVADDQSETNPEYKFYPNPISDFLNIDANYESHLIDIYALDGRLIIGSIEGDNEGMKIDVSSLTSGSYFMVGRTKLNGVLYRNIIIKN